MDWAEALSDVQFGTAIEYILPDTQDSFECLEACSGLTLPTSPSLVKIPRKMDTCTGASCSIGENMVMGFNAYRGVCGSMCMTSANSELPSSGCFIVQYVGGSLLSEKISCPRVLLYPGNRDMCRVGGHVYVFGTFGVRETLDGSRRVEPCAPTNRMFTI
ncbi:hypothetical protein KIPB_006309 [Kipferlia bialata]|uniref:Uncharacterized protein n=1 Tax=Kipferlia bialata TaxID=797122 RepID=A0A391NUF8_9EUKA|nr:hypothetical protein KIPB_006309 [Kipferlia bialata]|eukprot:g6309.t1